MLKVLGTSSASTLQQCHAECGQPKQEIHLILLVQLGMKVGETAGRSLDQPCIYDFVSPLILLSPAYYDSKGATR